MLFLSLIFRERARVANETEVAAAVGERWKHFFPSFHSSPFHNQPRLRVQHQSEHYECTLETSDHKRDGQWLSAAAQFIVSAALLFWAEVRQRWQYVYEVVSTPVHDVCEGECASYFDVMWHISVRIQESTPLPAVIVLSCWKFWCILNSNGYHGNAWRLFVSCMLKAAAWQEPKVTVVETHSNV